MFKRTLYSQDVVKQIKPGHINILFEVIQKNGYDKLNDGPKSSWLGYSLLPEGEKLENIVKQWQIFSIRLFS